MKKEVWGWALLAFAVVTLNCVRLGGPILADDSFQYLSIAENLAAGNGIRTSIVHFDTERSHGELPAPMTWFPAGYPAAMAVLSLMGIPRHWAGFGVSSLSLAALVLVIAWLCSWYRLSALATRLVLFLLIANSWTLLYSGGVLTESVFTAVSIGAIAVLAAVSEQTGKPGQANRIGLWALCGLLIGISSWARYAGVFLYASLGLFLAIEVVLGGRRDLRGPIAAVVTATIPLAVLLLRNVLLVGNWRGGNSIDSSTSVPELVRDAFVTAYELFFGELVRARFGVAEVLVVLSAGVCGIVVIRTALKHREAIARELAGRPSLLPVLTYVGVYIGALVYLSFFSQLGFSYRYCYPFLPLLLVLIGLLVAVAAPHMRRSLSGRAAAAAAVALLGCYVFLNVRNTLQPWSSGSLFADRRVTVYFEAPMPSGGSLRSWMEANVPADRAIAAANGQATAYVLRRKTVSMIAHDNSAYTWEEREVREVMTRFRADFLILYPQAPSRAAPQVQNESKFLGALAQGRKTAKWLLLAAENPFVKVFRRKAASR
ncbi:MAG: hypothetical protein WD733_15750 [Bryobacterales bacterium]